MHRCYCWKSTSGSAIRFLKESLDLFKWQWNHLLGCKKWPQGASESVACPCQGRWLLLREQQQPWAHSLPQSVTPEPLLQTTTCSRSATFARAAGARQFSAVVLSPKRGSKAEALLENSLWGGATRGRSSPAERRLLTATGLEAQGTPS